MHKLLLGVVAAIACSTTAFGSGCNTEIKVPIKFAKGVCSL
jgi:hypothetical protein